MKKRIKRIVSTILLVAISAITLCSCSTGKVQAEDAVTVDTVHSSSANAARGYIQAMFTSDTELFTECLPTQFTNQLTEEDEEQIFFSMKTSIPSGFEFLGTAFSAANEYTTENGYDVDYMKSNISMLQFVDEGDVAAIEIIKVRIYFYSEAEEKNQYTDVYVVVYAMKGQWYAFELQNADADFQA